MFELLWGGVALVAVYLIGGVSFAYFAARIVKGVDIRTVGSRNAGALNVFREIGVGVGFVVLAADMAKGAVAVILPIWIGAPEWILYAAPVVAIAGHNWPVLLRFRGGKGLAPVIGVSLVMVPFLSLLGAIPGVIIIALTKNVVVGGGVGFVVLNVLTIVTGQSTQVVVVCLVLSALVAGTHFAATWRQYVEAARTRDWTRVLFVE